MTSALTAPPELAGPRTRSQHYSTLPPALIVGGSDNALSIVRALARQGIVTYCLNTRNSDVRFSRVTKWIPLDNSRGFESAATDWLLGNEGRRYAGCVLLAANDQALSVFAAARDELSGRFLLDLCQPEAQKTMLDKRATYLAARAAGVCTPKFWCVRRLPDLLQIADELTYPVIVKPELSHVFQERFDVKFLVAMDFGQLTNAFRVVEDAGIDVMLVEKIPGPDSQLCSYYTWLNESSEPAFDFTKRIIRRFPANMGLATYHITDHVADVKEPAVRLFRHVGLQGLANAEFKRDERDGQLKLIECNARFTAANGLVRRAGIDLATFVYNRIVGLPLPPTDSFRDGMTLWDPMRDWKAFRQLQRQGELTWREWLTSIARAQSFTCFSLTDPGPALHRTLRRIRKSGR